MNRLLPFLAACFLVCVALIGCSKSDSEEVITPVEKESIPFREDGQLVFSRDGDILRTIAIEIAEDDSSRNRGLMQRESLPGNAGMLFIFPTESEQGFWMGNTQLALDFVWIKSDGRVHSMTKYIQPMRTETVPSNGAVQYVLEVEAGFLDSIGLIEGDLVEWTRNESE